MKTDVLKVTGMSCMHCKAAVEKAVGALTGVQSVTADFKGAKVTVTHQDEAGLLDKVKAAITQTGYTVAS